MRHFLLLIASLSCIISTATAASVSIASRDFSLLAEALRKVVDEVIAELAVTLNVVSVSDAPETNDFRDTFVQEITKNPRILVRQQMIEGLLPLGVRGPRKTCIIPIRSFADFNLLYAQLADEHFVTRGIYIFVLTGGRLRETDKMFALLWELQIFNANVIYEGVSGLVVETFFPFGSSENCADTRTVTINEYREHSFTHAIKDFLPNKMRDLGQCEVRVSTSNVSAPYIYMRTMPNGERRLHGRDYDFVRTLAQTLNFRLNFTYVGREGYVFANGSAGGPFLWLLNRDADMAVADYWLKPYRLKFFDASTAYINEKLVFVLPISTELTSIEKLLYPLTVSAWAMVFGCLLVGSCAIYVIKRRSQTLQTFVFGERVRYPYMNMWIALLGTQQHRLPHRNFSRFILALFLLFCLVVRTAYQGKMYYFMQSTAKHTGPQTIDEIIEREYTITVQNINADLVVGRALLKSVEIKPLTLELPQWATQIDNSGRKSTILLPYTQVYYKLIVNSTLNLRICRETFLTIPTVIYTTKNFYLLGAINEQIEAFNSAGLIDYWHSLAFDKKHMRPEESTRPKVLAMYHLAGIFEVWAAGCIVSALVFCVERKIGARRNRRVSIFSHQTFVRGEQIRKVHVNQNARFA